MNLAFATLTIRAVCECQATAEKQYGFAVARQLRSRLADLREVENILELPVGLQRGILGTPSDVCSIDLTDGYTLLVRANHANLPISKSGEIDWLEVSRVKIIRIEGSHA